MQKPLKLPADLLLILIWTMLTLVFVPIPSLSNVFLRIILGIPMMLFIPGYVLIAALFPKKDDLESIERIALSSGLSVAVVPLLGILLNFTVGIRLIPILITLCIYTTAILLIAAFMREKLPANDRFSISFHKIFESINNKFIPSQSKTDRILTAIFIFSIFLAIGLVI